MKGIVLAGGAGTRLAPLTRVVSKQLLPVYDKPLIYYPLSVLMTATIRDVLIITTPMDAPLFQKLLGTGEALGMRFSYAEQPEPNGLAEVFLIGRDFVGDDNVCLVLGDNIFYGAGLATTLQRAREQLDGAVLFGYQVSDPERYGVAELDGQGNLVGIEEKPSQPKSRIAITGLYYYDNEVLDIAAGLEPSARGELEITDVNNAYIARGRASLEVLGRGTAWLDTGTHESLMDASHFVHVLQNRQGTHIACLEAIAYRLGYIDTVQLRRAAQAHGSSDYGRYLREMADETPT